MINQQERHISLFNPAKLKPGDPVRISDHNAQVLAVLFHPDHSDLHPMPQIVLLEAGIVFNNYPEQVNTDYRDRWPTSCVYFPIPGCGRMEINAIPFGPTASEIKKQLERKKWFNSGAVWDERNLVQFFRDLEKEQSSKNRREDPPVTGEWERIVRE